jgi:hypothetical protein
MSVVSSLPLRDLGVYARIIFERILGKEGWGVWFEFIWLTIGAGGIPL